MSSKDLSRRSFLRHVAAGSTATALAPTILPAAVPDAPYPATVESYPIAAPGKASGVDRLKIVTQEQIDEPYQKALHSCAPNMEFKYCRTEADFRREIADAQVIYGEFSRDDLRLARELRWIQWTAAGVEDILWPEFVESPVVLTNMQRVYAPCISETAIGFMLALAHGINRYSVQTRERTWKQLDGLFDISGMTAGIVGLGGIGTEIARRAHFGFGMKILAVDPKPIPKPDFVAELHTVDWLPKMAPQVDFLVSSAPHTRESEGMFNEAAFRAMKPGAFFINMSRGKLVDTSALVRALKEGWIAGAGLDVAYQEPLPADEPLWTAGNVIITCHTSGHTPRTTERQMAMFTENVRRYLAGLPLLNVVDKRRGY